jgi:hypothetical protein
MATINAAEGVVRAFKDYAFPYSLIVGALVAGSAAAEIATIKNQKFAKGGMIEGQPHSRGGVNIEAEGGEFVINKRSASKYKGLIDAINQDDQIRIMDAMARDRKIEINRGVDPYTKKMYELMKQNPVYGEDNEFYYMHKGNMKIQIRKN